VRQIPSVPDKLKAKVQGVIEAPNGVLKITRIHCHFEVHIPAGKKDAAERALTLFDRGCPVAQTLKGSIEFLYAWDIIEY
jgi:uncharacterized OsmC-like protein